MKLFTFGALITAAIVFTGFTLIDGNKTDSEGSASLYDFNAVTIDNVNQDFSAYKNKTVLIVNVASKCGFTPQYEGLQELYEKYHNKGFVILGFPCNQFGGQEPGSEKEIMEFCKENYGVEFQMFSKIDVNGENAHPLYQYLVNISGQPEPIKWNFTKFLFGPGGEFIGRYGARVPPSELEPVITASLQTSK